MPSQSKNMKINWLSTLAFVAVLTTFSVAQSTVPPGGQATPAQTTHHGKHPIIAALEKVSGLTANQTAQIKGMLKQRKADDKSFRKSNPGNAAAIKAHNKQETKALMTSLKGVLSPAQWKQFEANLVALKANGRGNSAPASTTANPPVKP
jgi:hypothetical protein